MDFEVVTRCANPYLSEVGVEHEKVGGGNVSQIDLRGVFDGVKPQEDNVLPRLVTMIRVEEPIEEGDIPLRLLVDVNGGEIIRYQNLAKLPVEVTRILTSLPGSPGFTKDVLLKNIENLRIAVEKLPEEEVP